jgi:hypothetical protein
MAREGKSTKENIRAVRGAEVRLGVRKSGIASEGDRVAEVGHGDRCRRQPWACAGNSRIRSSNMASDQGMQASPQRLLLR